MRYSLLGVDEDGNAAVEVELTADQAVQMLASLVSILPPKIVNIGVEVPPPTTEVPPQKKLGRLKKEETGEVRRKGDPCPECDSRSNRHRNGCSKPNRGSKAKDEPGNDQWRALDAKEKRRAGMLESKYNQIKIAKSHGMDATDIARNMGITLESVEQVLDSDSYAEYTN